MTSPNFKRIVQSSIGFTLLEIVLASAVALIVGTFLITILVNNSGFFYKQNAIVSEGLGLNDVSSDIDNNIKQAAGVIPFYPTTSPIYTTGSETLILKLPSFNLSGIIENTYDFVVIAKDLTYPKILRRQIFTDPQSQRQASNQVLTTILESIRFNYYDQNGGVVAPDVASSVGVILTVNPKTGSIGSSRTSSILTSLRNH